jgi:putative drug exporter of the RND superfamily
MAGTNVLEDDHPAAATPRRSRGVYLIAGVAVLWLLIGLSGGSFEGKLSQVQKNDNSAYLPGSAEATKVDTQSQQFAKILTIPGFITYQRDSGLTTADRAKISSDAAGFAKLKGIAADQVGAPQFTSDGRTASISVPLVAKDNGVEVQGDKLTDAEKSVIKLARAGAPSGLVIHSAGPGGLLAAFIDAFSGIDGALILAAGLVVIVILLVVYRSPILWAFPLISAGLALSAAALVIYPLAKHDVITLNGQSQGILSVLVIGAGTDYALLLISRYREELHTYDSRIAAMTTAWRGAAPAIGASSITVILGLLCLGFGELNSDRSLGPVCAIGVACTAITMLILLPVLLVVCGRWIFWPKRPVVDHQADIATHGMWGRFAAALGRHPRRGWTITTAALLVCVFAIVGLRTGGLSTSDSFTNKPDAVSGTEVFSKNFPQGSGAPAVIIASAAQADEVIAAAEKVPGVVQGQGQVCIQTDFAKLAALVKAGGVAPAHPTGCVPAAAQIQPVNGRIAINANLAYAYDSPKAYATVRALRTTLHALPGAHALVGGQSAINYDTQQASRHDRNLIIPIVLLVILVVLGLVLRAILAPVILILTVVLSFSATLGVCAIVFNHVFHFANADPAFPLFAFVFLVALGIDYNIFLMTRVREETLQFGTRSGVLRGLSVTGGVITSAGVVLAATFVVLGVLPLVFLAELGFAVAFGVLLDTILVRSILVPALSHDIGRRIWWPSALARGAE